MGLPRNNKSGSSVKKCWPRSNIGKRRSNVASLSQPVPSTSTNNHVSRVSPGHRNVEGTCSQRSQGSPTERLTSEEENQFVGSLIRYLFAMDRGKQAISKPRIIKNVFGGQGKHFHRAMNKAKNQLSQIFGYRLVEVEGNKYILVNQVEDTLLHEHPLETERRQQVLLFLVLTHIFMHQESCGQELLWDFLTSLGIDCSDNHHDNYFGNVKHLITEVFVAQKYLNKTVAEKNDLLKVEFRWGPRAEHEFTRRKSLEFVSQIYNGRPMNSWPLQFKTVIAQEKSNHPQ